MNDISASEAFVLEANRLSRYRFLLLGGILLNSVLLARIPLQEIRAAGAPPAATPVPETTPAAPAEEASDTAQASAPLEPASVAVPDRQPAAAPAASDPASPPEAEHVPPLATATPATDTAPAPPAVTAEQLRAWKLAVQQGSRSVARRLRQRLTAGVESLGQLRSRAGHVALAARPQPSPVRATEAPAAPPEHKERPVPSPRSTPPAKTPPAAANQLVIANPAANGGPIHYLLDERVCTLEPGESQVLPAGRPRRIRYDQGGQFGTDTQTLHQGTFHFNVSATVGWRLVPVDTR